MDEGRFLSLPIVCESLGSPPLPCPLTREESLPIDPFYWYEGVPRKALQTLSTCIVTQAAAAHQGLDPLPLIKVTEIS